jgi:isopentenyl-diphosphate delta-isomerase
MSETASDIGSRKSDHLELAISGDVGFRRTTLLEQVTLAHCSLPELSYDALKLNTTVANLRLKSPIMISAMTGGTISTGEVNRQLAQVAEEGGYAIGLGSQRAMVATGKVDKQIGASYQLRKEAPTVPIFGNLGVVQAAQMSTALVEDMIGFVGASALCLHMNPAQELMQPEGDRDFRGCLDGIARLCKELSVPVVVKETGCGISREVAETLVSRGVEHLDVAGGGGTSWVGVEARRNKEGSASTGDLYWDWGVPTAASLLLVKDRGFKSVIASGGIKSGLDIARAISLGAHAAGIARPVLKALDQGGRSGALSFLKKIEDELKMAMVLTGSKDIGGLRQSRHHLGAELRSWASV